MLICADECTYHTCNAQSQVTRRGEAGVGHDIWYLTNFDVDDSDGDNDDAGDDYDYDAGDEEEEEDGDDKV